MTENDIQRLFVEHPFGEAKRMLAEEIEKHGRELSGNEGVFELRAIALECSRFSENKNTQCVDTYASGAKKIENGATTGSLNGTEEVMMQVAETVGAKTSNAEGSGQESEEGCSGQQKGGNGNGNKQGQEQEGSNEGENKGEESGESKESENKIKQMVLFSQLKQEIEERSEPTGKEGGRRTRKSKKITNGQEPEKDSESESQKQEQKNGESQEEKSQEEKPKEKTEVELEEEAGNLMREAQKKIEEANKIREERRKKEEEERRKREQQRQKSNRHYMTDEVVKRLKTLHKAFLVGPAGTGKSTLAMCACRELFGIEGSLEEVVKSGKFAQISFSPDTVSADMLGFTDVNGVFHETEIIRVFRDGGLILFDEMDDADASLLVKLNTMLANRVIPIPGKMVVQNPNTYIVGTANTYGKGGNSTYVGRSRLDGATLDRWKMATIDVGYDTCLEASIIGRELWKTNKKICHEIRTASSVIRELIVANKWKHICSTRFVIDAVEMAKNGYSWVEILNTFLLDWDETSARKVREAFSKKVNDPTPKLDIEMFEQASNDLNEEMK